MADDAPKVGHLSNNSAAMNRAAGEAQTSMQRNEEQPQDGRQQQGSEEWSRVKYAVDHLKPGAPKVGSSGNESTMREDAAATTGAGEGDVWQSAMERYEHESTSPTNAGIGSNEQWDAAGVHLPAHSQIQTQEERDRELAMRMSAGMDPMGMEYDQPPTGVRADGPDEPVGKLSLWATFKLLLREKPMMKFYLLGLVILLAATGAIIGVSLSDTNKSSSKDCSEASYADEPFLLLPEQSQSIRAGGFGSSVSASSQYLAVGAPDATCDYFDESCTVGGAAYLYKRSSNNEWALYSSFVLDDGVSAGDKFGQSVAISEDQTTMVVGAPKDDKLGIAAGAIYVMEEPFASTAPPIRLVSDDLGVDDEFGESVSASSTTLGIESPVRVTNVVAGASYDDDSGSRSGGVYVFVKYDSDPPATACGGNVAVEAGKWTQCQKLLPDDGESNDLFGRTVDVAQRTLVVGAMWDNNERGIDSGAAYVYYLDDGGSWSLQQKLLSTKFDSAQSDRFGVSVATSGERIVVGADLDDSGGDDSGAAYVFRLSNRVWEVESMLVPASGSNGYECGYSVDISSDGRTIIVGCPGAPGGGVALLYELQETGKWSQVEKFAVPEGYTASDLRLGGSVASSGTDGTKVVGYGKANGELLSYRKDC